MFVTENVGYINISRHLQPVTTTTHVQHADITSGPSLCLHIFQNIHKGRDPGMSFEYSSAPELGNVCKNVPGSLCVPLSD